MPKNTTPAVTSPVPDGVIVYVVTGQRTIPTTGKVAERNPDRWVTITGEFRTAEGFDEGGNPVLGAPLSITSKPIDRETAMHPAFSLSFSADERTATLTLPAGQRGARRKSSATPDDILAQLSALRAPAE